MLKKCRLSVGLLLCRTPSSRDCALRRRSYCRWSKRCSEPAWRRMNSTAKMYYTIRFHFLVVFLLHKVRVLFTRKLGTLHYRCVMHSPSPVEMCCRQSYSGSWRNATGCGLNARWPTLAYHLSLTLAFIITTHLWNKVWLNVEPHISSLVGCAWAEGGRSEGQTSTATQTQARRKPGHAGVKLSPSLSLSLYHSTRCLD